MIPAALYETIKKALPIPCVDLIVRDAEGHVLLLRRTNEPCRDQWWFPGGRVLFGEAREAAVRRKLKEECGLEAARMEEVGTFDLVLEQPSGTPSHTITTVYHVIVRSRDGLALDSQSAEAAWRPADEWRKVALHDFVATRLDAWPSSGR